MAKKKNRIPKQRIACTPSKVYHSGVNFPEIRRRREAAGLTQTTAAKAAGWVTQQQWASMENGKRPNPRIKTLLTVARVLKCTVNDLLK